MTFWQIAAGEDGRDYRNEFLRYGLAFVGGNTNIERMQSVQCGDIIVLKRGVTEIIAAGSVVERNDKCNGHDDKDWLYHFDGWELPAWCYVNWHIPETLLAFGGLARGMISRIQILALQDGVRSLLQNTPATTTYIPEPGPTKKISDDDLLDHLVKWGLRVQAAAEVAVALRRIRLLSNYYMQSIWDDTNIVGEHEARTFLVIPFLIALGWTEQQLKIEFACPGGGTVDIACFNAAYHVENSECVLLVETKAPKIGLDFAPKQALDYTLGFPECRIAVVTNGFCYKAFRLTTGSTFSTQPCACVDLRDLRDKYPRDPAVDGFELLRYLLPSYRMT